MPKANEAFKEKLKAAAKAKAPADDRSARRRVSRQTSVRDLDEPSGVNADSTGVLSVALNSKPAAGVVQAVESEQLDLPTDLASPDEARLLFMIYCYSKPAQGPEEKELCCRMLPLLVLVYEAILEKVLDFDYAPVCKLVSNNGLSMRMWMNICQDAVSSFDRFVLAGLVSRMSLLTEDQQVVHALQITPKGVSVCEAMTPAVTLQLREFLYHGRKLLQIALEGYTWYVFTEDGFQKESSVTDTEDVSYVSSPYLPNCLRMGTTPMLDNAKRAHESASGETAIQDELSEALYLMNVHVLVAEYVPVGENQMIGMNERLGSLDRCKGGMFTATVDRSPTDTQFNVATGLTNVRVLDFENIRCVNVEAEINYPEDDGIVQVEYFGIHISSAGSVFYGLRVDAVEDRMGDRTSLDHLSRVLVDIHQDSSRILHDVLSDFQRQMLDILHRGETANRPKFNIVIADEIVPFEDAQSYVQKSEFANELRQVIGDTQLALCFGPANKNLLLVAKDGILICGPQAKILEQIAVLHGALQSRSTFLGQLFVRLFILDSRLKSVRRLIYRDLKKDPENPGKIRLILNAASRDINFIQQMLEAVTVSVRSTVLPSRGDAPDIQGIEKVLEALDSDMVQRSLILRCKDLSKLMHGLSSTILTLTGASDIVNRTQMDQVVTGIHDNFSRLVDASKNEERSSRSLQVIEVVVAGSLCFFLIDRIFGCGDFGPNIDPPTWVIETAYPIVKIPAVWFLLNLAATAVFCLLLIRFSDHLKNSANGVCMIRRTLNIKYNSKALRQEIGRKIVVSSTSFKQSSRVIHTVMYEEPTFSELGRAGVQTELIYDSAHEFLLKANIQYNQTMSGLNDQELFKKWVQRMVESGVVDSKDAPMRLQAEKPRVRLTRYHKTTTDGSNEESTVGKHGQDDDKAVKSEKDDKPPSLSKNVTGDSGASLLSDDTDSTRDHVFGDSPSSPSNMGAWHRK